MKHKCDGKECSDYESEFCGERSNCYSCTRNKDHEGPHIACSLSEHNLAIWFDEQYSVSRDIQGFATAICKGGKVVLHLVAGTKRNEKNIEEIVKLLNQ